MLHIKQTPRQVLDVREETWNTVLVVSQHSTCTVFVVCLDWLYQYTVKFHSHGHVTEGPFRLKMGVDTLFDTATLTLWNNKNTGVNCPSLTGAAGE